ncbi:MAG: VWA domain-containing protein [Acidobacteria bacterium]|nr:VWA domain-containing protein [Acidobacteriota bacterium]
MQKVVFTLILGLFLALAAQAQKVTEGELDALGAGGKPLGVCPLKHTDVKAEISGFLSRVRVTQEFENSYAEKIEAVYVFPLPNNAAVDDMTMRIGDRVVRGQIKKREEAREIYETAKNNGQVASLLDQERTNIFTQSVANILPGEKVVIEISYVETLKYEAGSYEFVFPMTVGPRYTPNSVSVTEAQRISPPVARERAGHDISVEVALDAGVPLEKVESKSHRIDAQMLSANSYRVKLRDENTIPNKDFILRYDVSGKKIEDAVLTHRGPKGGYFTLILQPPDNPRVEDVTPKEIVFVVDTSGSMEGFPLDKAKESMKMAIDGLNPQDTFNLITFAGDTAILFDKPVSATPANVAKAQEFLAGRRGGGGTEMMTAIKAALEPSDAQDHVRVVCFMTDGYVGNEAEILGEIQKHPNARIFSFGIGSSVNRMLLDKMAEEGRGEVEYVALNDDGSAAAKRFYERVRSPLLTDISLDFGNLQVADVYPKRINDLFSAKPVVVHGRFTKPGSGTIKLIGKSFGRETVREIPVEFPDTEAAHDVLATLWARTRIDDLTAQDYGNSKPEIREQITSLGLEYRLMTQFTSFVAVEERIVTDGGQPRRIEVPVELPEGVSRKGIFGEDVDEIEERKPVSGISYTTNKPVPTRREKTKVRIAQPDKSLKSVNEESDISDGKKIDSGDRLSATKMPKPEYPQTSKATGAVRVAVEVDANGNVLTAKAAAGDQSLYAAAEAAAKLAKFAVPTTGGEIKKITGFVVYNFAKNRTVTAVGALQDARVEFKPNKYHSLVKALVERLRTSQPAAADEAKFVRDGRAELIVRVDRLTPETVQALKNAGFEVLTEMTSSNAVVGRIAIEKIAALAELEAVTYISPAGI